MTYDIDNKRCIFESADEMAKYVIEDCPPIYEGMGCPGGIDDCNICWEHSGIKCEIKNEESIKMTAENKQFTYTDAVYELIKIKCKSMDSIYEDYIVSLVGNCGLAALKRAGLLEACGVLNCRQLYVLVDKVVLPKDHIKIDKD